MYKKIEERGLSTLTDDDWSIVDEMAEDYEGKLAEDIRALHNAYESGKIGQ